MAMPMAFGQGNGGSHGQHNNIATTTTTNDHLESTLGSNSQIVLAVVHCKLLGRLSNPLSTNLLPSCCPRSPPLSSLFGGAVAVADPAAAVAGYDDDVIEATPEHNNNTSNNTQLCVVCG